MVKPGEIKRRADTLLIEIFRSIFEEIDTKRLRGEIDHLRNTRHEFDRSRHAAMLARRTAIRCAATGAVSGLPSGMIAAATLGADVAYLVYQQFRLILGIATIYGHEPSHNERFREALACLAYGSGLTLGKQGIAAVLESISVEGGVVAEKIGARMFGDRLSRVLPIIGVFSGGALNYLAVRAVGRTTIRYYESKIDPLPPPPIVSAGEVENV